VLIALPPLRAAAARAPPVLVAFIASCIACDAAPCVVAPPVVGVLLGPQLVQKSAAPAMPIVHKRFSEEARKPREA